MINLRAYPSLLFTPGTHPERFQNFIEVGSRGVILDIEDSVAEIEKDRARKHIIEYLSQKQQGKLLRTIRINNISTQAGLADLQALSNSKINLDAIVYPKTESAKELNIISSIFKKYHPQLAIFALIETGVGLSKIDSIIRDSENLTAILFGAADYVVNVGCSYNVEALHYARSRIVQAAAVKSIPCYDAPYFNINDNPGLMQEVKLAKLLGFIGKMAIHPNQIQIINLGFMPSKKEFEESQSIINTYESSNGEACQWHGFMIGAPVYQKAKHIVDTYIELKHRRK